MPKDGEGKPDFNCAALDPNHSHFLLVDDGTRGRFGREIETRAALEDQICGEVGLYEWEGHHALQVNTVACLPSLRPRTLAEPRSRALHTT